jgi:hypothetical protein
VSFPHAKNVHKKSNLGPWFQRTEGDDGQTNLAERSVAEIGESQCCHGTGLAPSVWFTEPNNYCNINVTQHYHGTRVTFVCFVYVLNYYCNIRVTQRCHWTGFDLVDFCL